MWNEKSAKKVLFLLFVLTENKKFAINSGHQQKKTEAKEKSCCYLKMKYTEWFNLQTEERRKRKSACTKQFCFFLGGWGVERREREKRGEDDGWQKETGAGKGWGSRIKKYRKPGRRADEKIAAKSKKTSKAQKPFLNFEQWSSCLPYRASQKSHVNAQMASLQLPSSSVSFLFT